MKLNWPVLVIALIFFYEQNKYFGWNGWPQSNAELICDGITLLLLAMAWLR